MNDNEMHDVADGGPPKEKGTLRGLRPSEALRAMCRGLEKMGSKEWFEVDMSVFVGRDSRICYGCAATCALIEALGESESDDLKDRFLAVNDRFCGWDSMSRAFPELDFEEFKEFEDAMDSARLGNLSRLAGFLGIHDEDDYGFMCPEPGQGGSDWVVHDRNWQTEIAKVEKFAQELEGRGL